MASIRDFLLRCGIAFIGFLLGRYDKKANTVLWVAFSLVTCSVLLYARRAISGQISSMRRSSPRPAKLMVLPVFGVSFMIVLFWLEFAVGATNLVTHKEYFGDMATYRSAGEYMISIILIHVVEHPVFCAILHEEGPEGAMGMTVACNILYRLGGAYIGLLVGKYDLQAENVLRIFFPLVMCPIINYAALLLLLLMENGRKLALAISLIFLGFCTYVFIYEACVGFAVLLTGEDHLGEYDLHRALGKCVLALATVFVMEHERFIRYASNSDHSATTTSSPTLK